MSLEPDTAILERVFKPLKTRLSPEAARAILALELPPADRRRLERLGDKSNAGTLTLAQRRQLDNYLRVGNLLALLKSQARLSLQSNGGNA